MPSSAAWFSTGSRLQVPWWRNWCDRQWQLQGSRRQAWDFMQQHNMYELSKQRWLQELMWWSCIPLAAALQVHLVAGTFVYLPSA